MSDDKTQPDSEDPQEPLTEESGNGDEQGDDDAQGEVNTPGKNG